MKEEGSIRTAKEEGGHSPGQGVLGAHAHLLGQSQGVQGLADVDCHGQIEHQLGDVLCPEHSQIDRLEDGPGIGQGCRGEGHHVEDPAKK